MKIDAADTGPLALATGTRTFLAAPTARRSGRNWDTVTLVDPVAKTSAELARSAWRRGLINWVAATDDWVVYVDQSAEQGPAAPAVHWVVVAVNVVTGTTRRLAGTGDGTSRFVPMVGAQDGTFFWTEAEADGTARELVWDTSHAEATPEALLRHVEMTPGSASILGDSMVYLGPNGRRTAGHTMGGDCWQVPLSGGAPLALTHTALAMGCAARGNRLVWSQHVDPDSATPPADGIYDDPYSLWTLDASTPADTRQLEEGYSATYDLHLTDDVLVWREQSGRVVLTAIDDPAQRVAIPGRVRRITAGSGGFIGLARSADRSVVIEIDEVRADD